jgi:hypothetical protein
MCYDCQADQVKVDEIGGTCSTSGIDKILVRNTSRLLIGRLMERGSLVYLGVNGKIILQGILKK